MSLKQIKLLCNLIGFVNKNTRQQKARLLRIGLLLIKT